MGSYPDLEATLDEHQDGDTYVIGIDCFHRVRTEGVGRCGSIARSDLAVWPHFTWEAVRWLHSQEAEHVLGRGEPRRYWFCQNCLTSASHPLMCAAPAGRA